MSSVQALHWIDDSLVNEDIKNYIVQNLGESEKGDGYLSEVLFVKVTGSKKSDGKPTDFNLVLKVSKELPAFGDKTQHLYKREAFVYSQVLPKFRKFELERNVKNVFDSVPKCYKTLTSQEKEILVLENLTNRGYEVHDRLVPMNMQHIKAVLRNYAKFHAISFAFKDQNREEFEKLTANYTCMYSVILDTDLKNFYQTATIRSYELIMKLDQELAEKISRNIIAKTAEKVLGALFETNLDEWVITHGDCWNNNFMFKYELKEDMDNYMRYKLIGGPIKMKPDVVPHIFDCQKDRKRGATIPERSLPVKRRHKALVAEALSSSIPVENNPQPSTSSSVSEITIEHEMEEVKTHEDVGIQVVSVSPSFRGKYVQCQFTPDVQHAAVSPLKISSVNVATSPMKVQAANKTLFPTRLPIYSSSRSSSDTDVETESGSTLPSSTSSEDYQLPKDDLRSVSLRATDAHISAAPKYYLGIPETWKSPILQLLCEKTGCPTQDIIITLMKIKLNDPFHRLGNMFGMSSSGIAKVFAKTIIPIEHHLKNLIFWPSSSRIKYYLPIPFRARYSNVQSIIDCLEIEIEKPTDPIKQALTWSEYKKCNTVKYLISATPDGFINFISTGYGGRISDSRLVQESGYLSILPHGCSVMADRGFKDIAKLLHDHNCELVRPPSVSSALKPTREEVVESKRITSLRIHIERVIRRLREFEFLKPHSVINHSLISQADVIIKIACALINLQNPIIK